VLNGQQYTPNPTEPTCDDAADYKGTNAGGAMHHTGCPPRVLEYPYRAGTDCPPLRPLRPQYPGQAPSTARGIPSRTGVPRSADGTPTSAPQCACIHTRWAQRGAYSKVSFAIEPIQLPIVPLNVFS
jgi:hypothetical protein